MNRPTFSVVIPNYNYGRFLKESIESVLHQTVKPVDIIVVDDGSSDNSLDVLAGFENKIKVIQQENSGVGVARNTGVENSTGDIIAFLDSDDIWRPNKLEKQLEVFMTDNEIGLVSCGMEEFDENGNIIGLYMDADEGWIADKMITFEANVVVSGSAIAIKREVFEEVEGFDKRRELHPSEDWELCYRIACVSKIAFVNELLVNYRNHGGNGHLQVPKTERAMMLAYKKIYKNAPAEKNKFKNVSYGNLHKMLAGSYFHVGQYGSFVRHTLKSLQNKPSNFAHFAAFPMRVLNRKKSNES